MDHRACYEAAFEPGDRAELVRASFACPRCLRAPGSIRLVDAAGGPVAEATCADCRRLWQVELSPAQALAVLLGDVRGLVADAGPQARRLRDLASFAGEDVGI